MSYVRNRSIFGLHRRFLIFDVFFLRFRQQNIAQRGSLIFSIFSKPKGVLSLSVHLSAGPNNSVRARGAWVPGALGELLALRGLWGSPGAPGRSGALGRAWGVLGGLGGLGVHRRVGDPYDDLHPCVAFHAPQIVSEA